MRHRHRRDGGITIRSTRYQIDAEGCIDCSEEHAALLARDWERVDQVVERSTLEPPTEPLAEPDRALEELSKDELLAMAEERGLDVTRRTSKLKLLAMLREAQE